jgi:valyl-tRNA synthetase
MDTRFDHNAIEGKIYESWEKSGFFQPENLPGRGKPFTIIMPPPNANGSLHIGHALFVTLEDIMIRYWRMNGRKSLWLPGADHAGFETQVVYNKKLEKEGRSFWEMPKEQLYEEIKEFTLANKQYMEGQLRKLGASCDWSREKFTLDDDIRSVVYDTFKKLYDDGLVYRAERPVIGALSTRRRSPTWK